MGRIRKLRNSGVSEKFCARLFLHKLTLLTKSVDDENIDSPDGLQFEIGYDLIEATMAGGPQAPSREL